MHDVGGVHDLRAIPKVFCPGYLQHTQPTAKQKSMLKKLGYGQAQIETLNPRSASTAIEYGIKHPKTPFARWLHEQRKIDTETY
jgi:hypothetical protein